ncbi:MAG TPA: hypothetical protein VGB38_06470, partial [bacterium]
LAIPRQPMFSDWLSNDHLSWISGLASRPPFTDPNLQKKCRPVKGGGMICPYFILAVMQTFARVRQGHIGCKAMLTVDLSNAHIVCIKYSRWAMKNPNYRGVKSHHP